MTRIVVIGDRLQPIRDLVEVLVERGHPLESIRVLSEVESGETVDVGPATLRIEAATAAALDKVDAALFCGSGELARTLVPRAAEVASIVVDATPYSRRAGTGILVVPELSGETIARAPKGRAFACAMPTTVGLAVALAPLHEVARVRSVVATVFEPASQRGEGATERLARQSLALLQGMGLDGDEPELVAFNMRPQSPAADRGGWSFDESMLAEEVGALLGEPRIAVAATIVRAPHFYGMAQSLYVELEEALSGEEIVHRLREGRGLLLVEELLGDDSDADIETDEPLQELDLDPEPELEEPVEEDDADLAEEVERPRRVGLPGPIDVVGSDAIHVARIRVDPRRPNAVALWIVYDDVRKGMAQTVVGTFEIALRNRA